MSFIDEIKNREKKEVKTIILPESTDIRILKAAEIVNDCCPEAKTEICCIKVLGSGCANCHSLYENAKEAVKTMGLSIEVEYITDMEKVMAYGVMSMPALVVNDKVVAMGKVLKAEKVTKLLHKLGF